MTPPPPEPIRTQKNAIWYKNTQVGGIFDVVSREDEVSREFRNGRWNVVDQAAERNKRCTQIGHNCRFNHRQHWLAKNLQIQGGGIDIVGLTTDESP